jgi:murein DD-endopeptidase MepM/ murein hydrolase activator NlpD
MPDWWSAIGDAPAPRGGRPVDPHLDLARSVATKYGLNPSLLAGVWDFESSGNPGAVNRSSGATGLGQVMPRERGFPDRPTQQELLDPAVNADWSARILKSGLDRYGSEDKALAAYLGAIDARGNLTGAVDANGTGGNRYIQSVRERQQRYTDLTGGIGPTAAAGPAPARVAPAATPSAAPAWWGAIPAAAGGTARADGERPAASGSVRPVAGEVITKAGQPYWSFGGGAHAGIDIAAKAGTPVRSPVAGEVVANLAAGQNPLGLSKGYGRAVAVRDAGGDVHIFGHGAPDFGYLPVGTKVSVGDVISVVGSPKTKLPGEATEGEHLHWEIRGGGDYGKQIDPERWLPARSVPATNEPRKAITTEPGPAWWSAV